ncbi:MAG: DUF4296 domain-containing protein [Chlorobi bacterium]|nr:DUF4296 domain-containing protein [Chlorobiota bacterium]
MKTFKFLAFVLLFTLTNCGQSEQDTNVCNDLMPDSSFALMLKDIYLIEASGDTINKAGMYKTLLAKYNLTVDSFDTIVRCYMFNTALMEEINQQVIYSLADDTITIRNQTK